MNFTKLRIDKKDRFDLCFFDNGTGNALDLELIKELTHYFENFPESGSEGVILSGHGNIFTVGLDIRQMLALNPSQIESFFNSFLKLAHVLTEFEYPFIAAINGHSPAGGCVIALTSDFRVMADDDKFNIGLNELEVGIMIPPAIFHLYSFWIGSRRAYQNILTSRKMTPREAKQIGLVDEIAEQKKVIELAILKMNEILSFDQPTWRGIKSNARIKLIEQMKKDQTNGHLESVNHYLQNNGKQILLNKMAELTAKKK